MAQHSAHPSVVIIGAGRVGSALAVRLQRCGHRIAAVVSKRPSSARRLAALVHSPLASTRLDIIPKRPDLIIVAVPDRAIAAVARQLAAHPGIDLSSACVLHTSGALTSDELKPLVRRGASIGSLHPIQTFPRTRSPRELSASLDGISYGFEGDVRSVRRVKTLVNRLKGRMVQIPKERKIVYHVACVVGSNYSVALIGLVEQLLKTTGGGTKRSDLAPLVRTSIEAALKTGARNVLTGPVARGDAVMIRRHLKELRKMDPALVRNYRSLGLIALGLASRSGRLRKADITRLESVLRTGR